MNGCITTYLNISRGLRVSLDLILPTAYEYLIGWGELFFLFILQITFYANPLVDILYT